MIFQSFERTLEEKDVNEIMEGLNKELSKQKDWQVR
jgi:phenylalanyl-tRNA synthetase beta subunit